MICSFSVPKFEERIIQRIKVSTCREDKTKRWRKGMPIQFWMGSPRNVSKHPKQFGEGFVTEVLPIKIDPFMNTVEISKSEGIQLLSSYLELREFAIQEGFDDWEDLKTWFTTVFVGRIIYWDHFRENSGVKENTLFI